MPAERLLMRKVREVLRLKYVCGASVRTIARAVGVGHSTVAEYLRRTAVIGITWPVPEAIASVQVAPSDDDHAAGASPRTAVPTSRRSSR